MLTVAVVDDQDIAFCMGIILAREGYRSEEYTSTKDFLARYTPKPGCVLLHSMMPGLDVFEVLREMRERQWTVPVVTTRFLGLPPGRKVYPYWVGHVDIPGSQEMIDAIKAAVGRP